MDRRLYLSAGLVVVQIHQAPGIVEVRFLGVQELTGEPHAESQIDAAPSPFPHGGRRSGVQGTRVVHVTAANRYVAPAARVHKRVRHAGADHGVHVSGFAAGCKQKLKIG